MTADERLLKKLLTDATCGQCESLITILANTFPGAMLHAIDALTRWQQPWPEPDPTGPHIKIDVAYEDGSNEDFFLPNNLLDHLEECEMTLEEACEVVWEKIGDGSSINYIHTDALYHADGEEWEEDEEEDEFDSESHPVKG